MFITCLILIGLGFCALFLVNYKELGLFSDDLNLFILSQTTYDMLPQKDSNVYYFINNNLPNGIILKGKFLESFCKEKED